ncbi:glycosyltransferase family 2 protein [Chamaesiphon sp.]|uniref:glycosyltransferase family 2 protein n=1 Tax=Chamaesiphon sp. TaxID=2814140 RepID=UPI0035938669
MSTCKISIVTISRNNVQNLLKTLDSVKNQDYQLIEHIIIDGDSQDGSKELLGSYIHSKEYSYFSELDNGISDAFNKGLKKSTGDLIFFLNSGDTLSDNVVISEVVKSYLERKWRFAVGITVTTSLTGEPISYQPPKLSSKFLKYFMFLPHQGVFCETSLHRNFNYDESLKTSMDYDLFIRMIENISIFYLPLIISNREPGGVSSDTRKRINEQSQIRIQHAIGLHEKVLIRVVNFLIFVKSYLKLDSPFIAKIRNI